MRIKKVKKTKNEYIYSGNMRVRNFAKLDSKALSENSLLTHEDQNLVLHNERSNHTMNLGFISEESFHFPNVVIVSDGFDFENKQDLLLSLENVCIIAVNRALKKWKLAGQKNINFYFINNPYKEAVNYLPVNYFPTCVASVRTNFQFLNNYPGKKYLYEPTPTMDFGYKKVQKYYLDDYRNPIAAALAFSFRLGARKVLTFCCDDSFEVEKEASVLLDNGLRTYPQHLVAHDILDAQFFWLKQTGIETADFSSGPEYVNAVYIKNEKAMLDFFEHEEVYT